MNVFERMFGKKDEVQSESGPAHVEIQGPLAEGEMVTIGDDQREIWTVERFEVIDDEPIAHLHRQEADTDIFSKRKVAELKRYTPPPQNPKRAA